MKKRTQLISCDEATPATGQHSKPCGDCPWRRRSLEGWTGSLSADDWVAIACSEDTADCHTLSGAQCAGLAIFRANICKVPRDPKAFRLPRDKKDCFATPNEFLDHHKDVP